MTVRDLYKILILSPKLIGVQFYDEQNNIYYSLHNIKHNIEEYEVLYIKDWRVENYPLNGYLRLSFAIAPPKTMIEATNTLKEIYNLIIKDERIEDIDKSR